MALFRKKLTHLREITDQQQRMLVNAGTRLIELSIAQPFDPKLSRHDVISTVEKAMKSHYPVHICVAATSTIIYNLAVSYVANMQANGRGLAFWEAQQSLSLEQRADLVETMWRNAGSAKIGRSFFFVNINLKNTKKKNADNAKLFETFKLTAVDEVPPSPNFERICTSWIEFAYDQLVVDYNFAITNHLRTHRFEFLPNDLTQDQIDDMLDKAQQNDIEAQWTLGRLCEIGTHLVQRNMHSAHNWYCLASDNGHAEATFHLGTLFEKGKWIDQNLDIAKMHYEKAASLEFDGAEASAQRVETISNNSFVL